ncbi:MAG: hypothetical protein BWZ10_02543 [candidate division BRC1 bacterium ADurb.BinA364]|nr:MAG: hypothetical protein BWZ10_02543 [candidate division BRC1 bacterium ADurb.BinA364]
MAKPQMREPRALGGYYCAGAPVRFLWNGHGLEMRDFIRSSPVRYKTPFVDGACPP